MAGPFSDNLNCGWRATAGPSRITLRAMPAAATGWL